MEYHLVIQSSKLFALIIVTKTLQQRLGFSSLGNINERFPSLLFVVRKERETTIIVVLDQR
jgi:hypothetical protein